MKRSRDGEIVTSPEARVSIPCVGFLTTTCDPGGVDLRQLHTWNKKIELNKSKNKDEFRNFVNTVDRTS